MTAATEYPFLQELRIWSLLNHLHVMISLYHQVVGMGDTLTDVVGNRPHVCDDNKGDAFCLNLITHIIAGIMGNREGPDLEITDLQHLIDNDITLQVVFNLLLNAIVMVNAVVYFLRGIHWHMKLTTERTDRLHMIGMVVGDQHRLN